MNILSGSHGDTTAEIWTDSAGQVRGDLMFQWKYRLLSYQISENMYTMFGDDQKEGIVTCFNTLSNISHMSG